MTLMTQPGRRRLLRVSAALAAAPLLAGTGLASAAPAARTVALRRVERRLVGLPTSDGAGVRLTRVIGQAALRHLDPFLMLDRFHSDDPGAYLAGFPDHPHRGFETVTIMRAGRMRHRDSQGNAGLIAGGGVQWMTAGRGIIHSEMPEQERGLMSGFQLWVNLPAREKMCAQAYQDLAAARIVEGALPGAGSRFRLVAGRAFGQRGPVRERPTQPLLLTATLEDDRPFDLDLPPDHTAFLFVTSGEVALGPDTPAPAPLPEGTLAVLGPGNRLRARATNRRSEVLIAAARPLREPIVQRGPFVMNTEAEIARAMADYRAGLLDR